MKRCEEEMESVFEKKDTMKSGDYVKKTDTLMMLYKSQKEKCVCNKEYGDPKIIFTIEESWREAIRDQVKYELESEHTHWLDIHPHLLMSSTADEIPGRWGYIELIEQPRINDDGEIINYRTNLVFPSYTDATGERQFMTDMWEVSEWIGQHPTLQPNQV